MPGSRVKEVRMNLPVILESAAKLAPATNFCCRLRPRWTADFLQIADRGQFFHPSGSGNPAGSGPVARWNYCQWHRYRRGRDDGNAVRDGVPGLAHDLSRWGDPRVKVPYFAMVNLIAGEEVVPELVQQDFTAENVVTRLNEIIADGPARDKMIAGLAGVKARLRGHQCKTNGTRRIGLLRRFCASTGRGPDVKNWLNLVLPASFGTQSSSYGLSYVMPGDCF